MGKTNNATGNAGAENNGENTGARITDTTGAAGSGMNEADKAELEQLRVQNKKLAEDLAAEKAAHEQTENEAAQMVTELQNKVASVKMSKPTKTIDGVEYVMMYTHIEINNKTYTAEELLANVELCRELIKMKSRALRVVVKAAKN